MPVAEWRGAMPVSAEGVYEWHARPGAFERLVPPWRRARVSVRPAELADGSRLEFRYRAGPFTGRWISEYANVIPGRQFVDRQVRGPFARWEHTHRFVPAGEDGSELIDHIEYGVPAGELSEAVIESRIRDELERVFWFRHERARGDLRRHAGWAAEPRLKIAVSGSSGLIGANLTAYLRGAGHEVLRLVRRPAAGSDEASWDPAAGRLDDADLAGVDAVVNLAGVSIASLWTRRRRRAILESRVQATRTLASSILRMPAPPKVFVSASAVGAYGSHGDEDLTEASDLGAGFLADVCRSWEAAAGLAREAGTRVVTPRFGIVVSAAGGPLATMLPFFRAGLGAKFGDGRQWWSWIALDDLLGALEWLLHDQAIDGVVNATAPNPVRNAEFTTAVARLVRRPGRLKAPRVVVAEGLRGVGREMLLASQRVLPARLQERGFRFAYPDLEAALRSELGRRPGGSPQPAA